MIDRAALPPLVGPEWAIPQGEKARALVCADAGRLLGDCSAALARIVERLRTANNARWWRHAFLWAHRDDRHSLAEKALPLLWHKWKPQGHTLEGWRKLRDQILSTCAAGPLTSAQKVQAARLVALLRGLSEGTELEPDDHAVALRLEATPVRDLAPVSLPVPPPRNVPASARTDLERAAVRAAEPMRSDEITDPLEKRASLLEID